MRLSRPARSPAPVSPALFSLVLGALAFSALPANADDVGAKNAAAPTNPVAVIDTSLGEIQFELFRDKAPVSTKNFIQYAEDGHYNGTVFHRVLKNYIVQGGGYDQRYERKPTRDPIKNEAENGLKNRRGTISMARTRIVDSGTAQFFVNIIDNPSLDHVSSNSAEFGYAVFGRVKSGMPIVDRLANLPTGACGTTVKRDCPQDAVVVKSVRIVDPGNAAGAKAKPDASPAKRKATGPSKKSAPKQR